MGAEGQVHMEDTRGGGARCEPNIAEDEKNKDKLARTIHEYSDPVRFKSSLML